MACPVCASLNIQTKTSVDMVVHFSGFKLCKKPGVPLVSPLSVCLDCGFAKFTISKPNLDLLQVGLESGATDSPSWGAAAVKNSAEA
jgi:hypothetical protein